MHITRDEIEISTKYKTNYCPYNRTRLRYRGRDHTSDQSLILHQTWGEQEKGSSRSWRQWKSRGLCL